MKVMSKDALIKANMVEYTRKEKQILASIEHPFIVSLSWAFQTKAKLYLVMDFLPGGELYVHLRRQGRFREDKARFYASQILLAFEYLHSLNIIFRDLKPENVVLGADGYASLTDFGMAKRFSATDRTSSFCGTDAYLSPEMIKGETYGCENDWWSLGILIYEMIQGDVPFYSDNVTAMYDSILHSQLLFSRTVSAEAKDILTQFLSRNKSDRLLCSTAMRVHPFFKEFDFDGLLRKEILPPFTPDLRDGDTKYFDEKFTAEKPMLSVCKPPAPQFNEQFDGFSYQGPHFSPPLTASNICNVNDPESICRSNPDVEYMNLIIGSDFF
jgi:serine/threonine protein kinase